MDKRKRSGAVRWRGCPISHGPATEEISYVPQGSGPGAVVVACEKCACSMALRRVPAIPGEWPARVDMPSRRPGGER